LAALDCRHVLRPREFEVQPFQLIADFV